MLTGGLQSVRRVASSGEVVHVEVTSGRGQVIIVVMAAWMLDATAFASLTLGPPQASVEALVDLHRLLIAQGPRQSSLGVQHTDGEASDADQMWQDRPPKCSLCDWSIA